MTAQHPIGHTREDGFRTPRQAAEFLKVSIPHVYVLMDRGALPSTRFGRCRRIPIKALREMVDRLFEQEASPHG
jgi:excisionase family DNA binding protein